MKNKKNLVIGFTVLLLMGGMNLSHALDDYGFLDGSLCQSLLAQSSSSGNSSSGSSSSTSSSSSSSGTSSTDKKGDKFTPNLEKTESKKNGVTTKETVITKCDEIGTEDCKAGTKYRYLKDDGNWSEWIPA